MGFREHYEQGVFCWIDLMTTDQEAAKQFYQQLFQWTFQDQPMAEDASYSMALKQDQSVAAIFSMSPEMKEQHLIPHWQLYVNVQAVDEVIPVWQEHGGLILQHPFDVLAAGRMAIVQDPTGGVINLWQAKNHIGCALVNEMNTFSWAELQTRQSQLAAQFYQAVFKWEIDLTDEATDYITCNVGGRGNCGIFDMDKAHLPAEIPTHWTVYFNVENLDASLEIVKQAGGQILMDPLTISQGRFTTIADPQGATLVLIQLNEVDD